MPVRARNEGNFYGYGSLGFNTLVPGDRVKITLLDEAVLFNSLTPPSPIAEENPTWRWYAVIAVFKFTALSIDADRLQRYNAITGKAKFGTVICRHNNYVSREILVSYADLISAPFGTSFLFEGAESKNDEVPCDEPPVDVEFPLLTNEFIIPASGAGDNLSNFQEVQTSTTRTFIADEVEFYPERGLQTYNFGIGYRYIRKQISQQVAEDRGIPILVNQ